MNILQKIQNSKVFKGRFTFLCLVKDKIMFNMCPRDKRLLEIKGKYQGRRCFIIALGPSLVVEDLNILHKNNEYTFSMNKCYKMFDKTEWRPNCYFLSDSRVFIPQTHDAIFKMADDGIDLIYSKFAVPKGMPKKAIYYKAKYTDAILSSSRKDKYREKANSLKFSTNAYEFIYDGHTCVHSIIQLAYYMGFKEVYLLGADCGVTTKEVYTDLLSTPTNVDIASQNKIGDLLINDYASLQNDINQKNLNFKIYNATNCGRLEVFQRVNLQSLFK